MTNPILDAAKKTGKLRWSLLPIEAMEATAKVADFGATKHSPNGWRQGPGFPYSVWLDAMDRHIAEIKKGIHFDPETGLPHAAHIACNALFLCYYVLTGLGADDRFLPGKGDPSAK